MDSRLALFYLFDTLCKNRRIMTLYRAQIAPHISPPFISTYRHANDVTRKGLDKLLTAWRNNAIFDAAILDQIEAKIRPQPATAPTPPPSLSHSDPRKRTAAVDDAANKRARYEGGSSDGRSGLAPEIESTLMVLEQSLAAHPQLLPLLADIQQRLRLPGADLSSVAPRIQQLTQALQAAIEAQTRRTPPPPLPPQQYSHPPPNSAYAQPPQGYGQGYPPLGYSAPAPHSAGYPYQQAPMHGGYAGPPPPQPPQYLGPPPSVPAPRRSPERERSPLPPRPSRPKTFDTEDLKTSASHASYTQHSTHASAALTDADLLPSSSPLCCAAATPT